MSTRFQLTWHSTVLFISVTLAYLILYYGFGARA